MKKAIHDNRACFVCEDLEEAQRLIMALIRSVPFLTEICGTTYQFSNIRDVSITIIFSADISELPIPVGGGKHESVCMQ